MTNLLALFLLSFFRINSQNSFLEISYVVFWSIQIHYEQSAYNCILCKNYETFYKLPQIFNLKFSFWDHYFRWSKVVKLGPIQNQIYEMSKATFAYFSRFCLLLWSPETVDYCKSDIFIK